MKLGDFLVAYLRKIGTEHLFGIPGDLALKLFFSLGRSHGFQSTPSRMSPESVSPPTDTRGRRARSA